MKKILTLLLLMMWAFHLKAQHSLLKLWETDTVFNLPESVLPSKNNKILYISVMGNDPVKKDGIGGVAKICRKGKIKNLNWIEGLNAPKGLAISGNLLYAADVTDVVVIDIAKSKVIRKIPIENAVFLNDITVSDQGIVYVSDTRTNRIHKIENNIPTLYLDSINSANGLKAIGEYLYIISGKNLWKANAQKAMTKIAELPHNGDGLEPIGNGDFLFSSWSGYLYYVYADGKFDLLLDATPEKKNTADIGYDQKRRIVYIPTFYKKTVMAYKLK